MIFHCCSCIFEKTLRTKKTHFLKSCRPAAFKVFFPFTKFFSIYYYLFDHFVFSKNVVRSIAFQFFFWYLFFSLKSCRPAAFKVVFSPFFYICFLKSCRPTAFKVFLCFFFIVFSFKAAGLQLFKDVSVFFFRFISLKAADLQLFMVFSFFTLRLFFFVLYSFFPATMVIECHGHCTKKTHVTFSLNSIIEMATGLKCNRLMHRYSTAILIISHSLATS